MKRHMQLVQTGLNYGDNQIILAVPIEEVKPPAEVVKSFCMDFVAMAKRAEVPNVEDVYLLTQERVQQTCGCGYNGQ